MQHRLRGGGGGGGNLILQPCSVLAGGPPVISYQGVSRTPQFNNTKLL